MRDHYITIPESHIRKLEDEIASLKNELSKASCDMTGHSHTKRQGHVSRPGQEQIIENCTTEHFVWKLRSLSKPESINDASPGVSINTRSIQDDTRANQANHTYTPLNFDSICKLTINIYDGQISYAFPLAPRISLRFPSYPHAIHLFEVFCSSFEEYHWFLRKSFRDRLESMYTNPSAQSKDRNWLCKLSVLLALAESLSTSYGDALQRGTSVQYNPHQRTSLSSPPGAELFDQGLQLLKISYEEPCIEQVEALNLIMSPPPPHNPFVTMYWITGS